MSKKYSYFTNNQPVKILTKNSYQINPVPVPGECLFVILRPHYAHKIPPIATAYTNCMVMPEQSERHGTKRTEIEDH